MQILDLVQGSKEWHEVRSKHFCASDAPAMMNASKYKSRTQLLDEMSGAVKEEVDPYRQAIMDKGHKAEEMARTIIELDNLGDFPPVVCVAEIDRMPLLASLDGLSDWCIYEHKLYNQTLAENIKNGVIEAHYYWQLEHQLLVSGMDNILFVCSDGTRENWVQMTYTSIPVRRKKLIEGWKLFQADLKDHEIQAKIEPVEPITLDFPAVKVEVNNGNITTNIANVLQTVKTFSDNEIANKAETDQDFANKTQLGKKAKNARDKLKEIVKGVKDGFVSFSEFTDYADALDSALQKLQSDCERQAKQGKEEKKRAIVKQAHTTVGAFIGETCDNLKPLNFALVPQPMAPDFVAAMKGKRTLDSCQKAVDAAVNQYKIAVNLVVHKVEESIAWFNEYYAEYDFLFSDLESFIHQEKEAFDAICKQRVAEHKEREELRKKRAEETNQGPISEGYEKLEAAPVKNANTIVTPNEVGILSVQDEANFPEGLLEELADWCDKQGLSLAASEELNMILNKYLKAGE